MVDPCPSVRALALLACVALPPVALGGGSEKDFEECLQVVDRMIASGKGKKAKELLLSEIEARKGETYVLYHLSEIQDELRRATFWSTNEKPAPKALVSGDLLSWSPTSGQIRIRYSLADGGEVRKDFTEQGDLWVHPLIFDGPFTIEIRGSSYPAFSEPVKPPSIFVCGDWASSTCVVFGLMPHGGTYLPARIIRLESGDSEVLDTAEPLGAPGEEFVAKVVVTGASVTGYLNDMQILSAKRSEPIDGRFAFANFPSATEILVTGKVTSTWLMNVVDAAVQERWSAFEKGSSSKDHLPDWLREKAWSGVPAEAASEEALPDEKTPKGMEHMRAFSELLKKGKHQDALDYVGRIAAEEVSEGTRALLASIALDRLGRGKEALDACSKACTLDPRCLPARRMKLALEEEHRTLPEVIEGWKAVVADFPGESDPYVRLARLHLRNGHPEEARSLVRGAIDSGVPAGTLEETEHLVARALKGPLWAKRYEYKSEHYTVASDISQRICFDAAGLLEKFYTKFNLHLRHVPKGEKRIFRVFLFSGRAGYDAYSKDLTGREFKFTAGLYSPDVKQLLIWNLLDSESTMRTVRHEGFHQYLDRLTDDAPIWLNEGLAEYYEGSRLVKGAWSDGEINERHLATLESQGLVPLAEFLSIRHEAFQDEKTVTRNYAEAWAFVHFLLSGGPENKKLFDRLLDALIGGTKGADAIGQVFPGETIARLEREFAAYVRRLH